MAVRIQVVPRQATNDRTILHNARRLGIQGLTGVRTVQVYFLSLHPGAEHLRTLCAFLLADPVTQEAHWLDRDPGPPGPAPGGPDDTHVIEVALRPGVTNVVAQELERGLVELGLPPCRVATALRYELTGRLSPAELHRLARRLLCNETIEHYTLGPIRPHFGVEAQANPRVEILPLRRLAPEALVQMSRERLLALDRDEMEAIQGFYRAEGRDPTDVELETLAQTWSEHCAHKTFRAEIRFTWLAADGSIRRQECIDGLLKRYIQTATESLAPEWLRSAFVDNAGIIAFDDRYDLAFKVETHNHPSALEPFGGANTGIGGVVRDILGVSARPIACTDVLCFGPQDLPYTELPEGVLHPQRIAEGVVAGIGDYGNKLGLPTVNGAVVYHPGYTANPLVYCGAVGLLPRGAHPTCPRPGDRIVVVGGRTGRDGIHGATFSSGELTHETGEQAGSAVQIGDPITEKGLVELVEAARDEGLYTAITDCGAGGLSSAIGEMGAALGVEVELQRVPLKYPGLTPWEIWLSEAQERMVMAVPPEHLERLQALARLWGVEAQDLGTFTGDGWLRVRYGGQAVAQLPMAFLHRGRPRRRMEAVYRDPTPQPDIAARQPEMDWEATLLELLGHPTVASKEAIVRTYDHEVRGGTLVRPLEGPALDGPSDAAVLKPLETWDHPRAIVLSVGIQPLIGLLDPYAMAVAAVDEAVRNAVAVGGDPERLALLDNFCWGNPTLPDRLGGLVRACQGCHDAALAYGTPFISGKDSLYNEFNGRPIPGTLLISAIGLVWDMARTCTSPLKRPGNWLYLLGETRPELGGSLLHHVRGHPGGTPPRMPAAPRARYRALHRAIQEGWVQACHDLSEGGLAVALAEMCLAGRLGAWVDLAALQETAPEPLALVHGLFAESNGRLLLEVAPEDAAQVEAHFGDQPLCRLGQVTDRGRLEIVHGVRGLIDLPVETLVRTWQGPAQGADPAPT